jgi:charged multivesicular body protein 7
MVISGKLYPSDTFMASVTAINDPGSLTYRFIGRPLLWGLRKVNPFGGSTEEGEKEEAIW